jgi:hypothetical protein
MPVKTLDMVQDELNAAHGLLHAWRKVANLEPYRGISPGSLCSIVHGWEPKKPVIRARLGLPQPASVIVISGSVPAGSQVLSALQCPCGRYFISNHPRRRRCFICSPFRKAGKHETQPA